MSTKGRIAVLLWIAGLLACVVLVGRTRIDTDMSAFLPRSPTAGQQLLVDQLREGVVSRLLLVGLEGAPAETLARLSGEMAKRLRQDQDFALVGNGEDAGFAKDGDFLWRNRYLLSPGVTPERFTVAGLRRALENDLQQLSSPVGAALKQSLPGDPTGEMSVLIGLLADGARPASRDGVWFSADGSRAVLVLETRAGGVDLDGQEQALLHIDQAFAAAKSAVSGAETARLLETGPGVFAVHARDQMKGDATRFSVLASILVAGLLLVAYRSVRVLVFSFLPVASGALAGIAAVGTGFGFVHGITLGFGVTLIGEAVDYAIYLFTQTAPGSPPEETLPRIWPTLRLGMLTSISGFSAMLLSNFTGFAQLGLFTIVGLVTALGVTRWVLPALLPRNFATAPSAISGTALVAAIGYGRRLRLPLLALMILAVAIFAFHRGGYWEDELSSLSPLPAADQALDRQLRGDVGDPGLRYLAVVSAPDQQQALAASEKLAASLQGLVSTGALAGVDSPDRYLPSAATQRARQAALPDADELRRNLTEALAGLPFRADLFAPFLADITAAKTRPLLQRGDLKDTSLSLKLDSLLLDRHGSWTAMLSLRAVADPARVAEAIGQSGVAGAALLDLKSESDRLLSVYRNQALMLSLVGSVVIVLLLFASLRSPRRVALVLAPLAGAVIVTAAVLTLGGQKLSIFNLFGLLLVVAVGSNYALFFERQNDSGAHRERMVVSLLLANLCTVIGFGILSFSHLPVLHGIGGTVALGALLSLVFSAILIGSAVPAADATR